MRTLTTLFNACALSLGMIGAAQAQTGSDEHATHHPAKTEASAPAAAALMAQMAPESGSMMDMKNMKNMEAHMQTMNDMLQKMASAKSPEERQALMADHMKSMSANGADMQGCRKMMESMMNSADPASSPATKG